MPSSVWQCSEHQGLFDRLRAARVGYRAVCWVPAGRPYRRTERGRQMSAPPFHSARERVVVGSYEEYHAAQRAVDHLSDEHFPVEHSAIVGSDLKLVESVHGRMNYGKAAASGAGSGAWFGLLIGLLIGIFAISAIGWLWFLLWGLIIGAAFGAVFGLIAHAATGGQRDFESDSQIIARRYEVLVDRDYAARATELLGTRAETTGEGATY